MDVQMPKLDGLRAAGQIREFEAETGQHILIFAMTAHALAGDREKCIDAGMDEYVGKPIQRKQLERLIA
jgi:CheY-like chemotaxis protein